MIAGVFEEELFSDRRSFNLYRLSCVIIAIECQIRKNPENIILNAWTQYREIGKSWEGRVRNDFIHKGINNTLYFSLVSLYLNSRTLFRNQYISSLYYYQRRSLCSITEARACPKKKSGNEWKTARAIAPRTRRHQLPKASGTSTSLPLLNLAANHRRPNGSGGGSPTSSPKISSDFPPRKEKLDSVVWLRMSVENLLNVFY